MQFLLGPRLGDPEGVELRRGPHARLSPLTAAPAPGSGTAAG